MSEQVVTRQGRLPAGELALAAGILGLGGYAVVRAGSIIEPVSAAGAIGPRTMPYVVGGMLIVTGGTNLVKVLRGDRGVPEGGEDVDLAGGTDWLTAGLLALSVLVHAYLIDPLGWPVAGGCLFGAAAIILGTRPAWRAVAIGFVMAFAIQLMFAGGLDVSLPPGPFFEGVAILGG